MNGIIEELVEGGVIKGEIVALDTSFIKTYSKRDPHDNSKGYSDHEEGRACAFKRNRKLGAGEDPPPDIEVPRGN